MINKTEANKPSAIRIDVPEEHPEYLNRGFEEGHEEVLKEVLSEYGTDKVLLMLDRYWDIQIKRREQRLERAEKVKKEGRIARAIMKQLKAGELEIPGLDLEDLD